MTLEPWFLRNSRPCLTYQPVTLAPASPSPLRKLSSSGTRHPKPPPISDISSSIAPLTRGEYVTAVDLKRCRAICAEWEAKLSRRRDEIIASIPNGAQQSRAKQNCDKNALTHILTTSRSRLHGEWPCDGLPRMVGFDGNSFWSLTVHDRPDKCICRQPNSVDHALTCRRGRFQGHMQDAARDLGLSEKIKAKKQIRIPHS